MIRSLSQRCGCPQNRFWRRKARACNYDDDDDDDDDDEEEEEEEEEV